MNILLIEDERQLALTIVRILSDEGYRVEWRANGAEGLKAGVDGKFDLIILDVLLPRMNGWEICEELRTVGIMTPILMLSAVDQPRCKARGLDLGADDFLAKPFDVAELLARVRARLRKDAGPVAQTMHVADLEIDRRNHQVRRNGSLIPLSRSEYKVLEILALGRGRPILPDVLADIAGYAVDPLADPVKSCVAGLKNKIDEPYAPPLIHASAGGYYLLTSV